LSLLLISVSVQYFRTRTIVNELRGSKMGMDRSLVVWAEARKILDWPLDKPMIVEVSTVNNLQTHQPFFKAAINGDWLIFNSDQVALYRPSEHKIINVGSWYVDNAILPKDNSVSVEIRNGSEKTGRAGDLATLWQADSRLRIVGINNAATTTYQNSLVIKNNKSDISFLDEYWQRAVTTTMPAMESSSTADILIILGNDYVKK